jgi:hypothetical protein
LEGKGKELALAAAFLQSEEAVPWKQQVGPLPSKLLACEDFHFFGSRQDRDRQPILATLETSYMGGLSLLELGEPWFGCQQ